MDFLKGLTSTFGNAAQGVGNFFSQQFSPAVQRFGQMAVNDMARAPIIGGATPQEVSSIAAPVLGNIAEGAKGLASGVGQAAQGVSQQGFGYFNPQNVGSTNAPKANFWTTPFAQQLGGQAPLPKFNFAEQINQKAGGGIPGAVASALPGMAEGFLNIPSQIGQAYIDTAQAINTGQPLVSFDPLNPIGVGVGGLNLTPKGLGLAAEFGQPLATIATAGEAPELLAGVKDAGWAMSALKGLLNGLGYGGMFGGLQGLQENQDTQNVPQQLEKALPYVWNGMVTGGTLGTILGPAGKFFFGNKTPGETATLAQHGLVPPETITDAYKVLNVSPEATLPEVQQAYTSALKEFHPQFGGTSESLDVLNNAYEMATRSIAPTLKMGTDGNPYLTFSDEFGSNTLTTKQVAEARRAAADHTAFQARIANLKAGRLPVKNPNQPAGVVTQDDFLQHGADLLTPEGQQAISAKTQQAQANQPAFHDLLDTIGQQFGGKTLSNLKNPQSIAQKIVEHRVAGETDYGLPDVQDGLRGTIVVNDKSQVPQAVQALKDELQTRGWQRKGEGEDYFAHPQTSGYEGYHLNIGMPDGTIAEIQIHTPQSLANAKLTHDVYSTYNDENLPKPLRAQLKNLQAKIRTDPVAKLETQTHQYEADHPTTALSPMESDFTGRQQPLTEAGQIAQRLQAANPDVDYRGLNYRERNAQASDQRAQVAVDQTRVKLGQPTTAESITQQGTQQAQAWNEIANQNHYVDNLVRIRDGLKTKLETSPTETTPEIDGLVKMRGQLQDQIDQAENFIAQNRNNPAVGRTLAKPSEIRVHIKDLKTSLKNIDDQVKGMQVKLKGQHQQTTEGLKAQIDDLNRQIEQEQTKLRVKTAITQPVQLPNDFGNRAQIRDIVDRQTPESSTQPVEAPSAQFGQKTPAQQAFEQTKTNQQAQASTAKTQPLPNGVSKTGSVFTFTPIEGGAAKTGTPVELGLSPSGKSKDMWEDEQGNQYSAQHNPEAERAHKQKSGLPSLRTASEVMQETNGKIKLDTGKNRNALQNAINYGGVPMDLTLSRSPNTNARIAGFGILDAQNAESEMSNRWLTTLENTEKGLSDAEIANGIKVQEGLEKPMSSGASQYAKVLQDIFAEADQKAKVAGVMTRNADGSQQPYQSLENFFPHTWTKAQYEAMAEQAKTPQESTTFRRQGQLYTSRFGNMEQHRGEGMGSIPYRTDKEVAHEYARSAAHKIATTSVFGANSERAANLIQNMTADGNMADANTFKKALEVNGIAKGPNDTADPTEKLMSTAMQGVRAGIDFTNLGGVTGIHHLTVAPGLVSQYGFKNTLKALPEFGKAFIGKPSEFARQNVTRLHATPESGIVGTAMEKFYKAIQLDRALNALSAHAAGAANFNVADMEKNLSDPTVRTNILQAHLPYDDIVQRGFFTPEEKHAYIQAGLKNAGLLFQPDNIAKIATHPIGKAIMALSGPMTARTQRQVPFLLHQIQDNANFSPAMKFAATALLLGTVSKIASNLIQNHPQGTPQQLLTEGALAGMGVNYGPISTTGLANMIQYPEYTPSIAAGMLGGPLAGMAANGIESYQNITSNNPSDQNTGLREATRYLPIVGPTVANSLFPAKSWVGNRPTDLVKILATGNAPQDQNGITVQHSPMDFLRANPTVAAQQAKVSNIMDQQNTVLGKLNAQDSQQYQLVKQYEASGDPQQQKIARQMMAQNPNLFDARAKIEAISAKANGLPVDPRYDPKNRQTALDYLQYQNMTPAERAGYVAKNQGVIDMDRQLDAYRSDPAIQKNYQQLAKQNGNTYTPYVHNPLYDTNTDGSPKFSNQDIAAYRVYGQMPKGTNKTSYLANHPTIMGAQLATFTYNQQQLQNQWDHRPQGQTVEEFMANPEHQDDNMAGVDPQTGKIIPNYNLLEEPKYQVYAKNPQAGALIQVYKAAMANKNYAIADQALAKMPWYPTFQAAERTYFAQHPFNSETNNELGGLGIDFSGSGGSGSGGGSSSYMSYVQKQQLYSILHDTVKAPAKLQFKPSAGEGRQTNTVLKGLATQQDNLVKLIGELPKIDKLPILRAPKLSMPSLDFKESPSIPPGTQGRVEAGRIQTRLQ